MQLTITSTATDTTDLGFLLHKNPATLFEKEMTFGRIRVLYPEAQTHRCTAALQVDVDPVGLVRGRSGGGAGGTATLAQYVSDRPYAASSFLSVALAEAFGTALGGRSKERQERVDEKMPLLATVAALGCDGGEPLIRRIFEPLGYAVAAERVSPYLDDRYPDWGLCDHYTISLTGVQTVRDLLTHLYVLVPVLDNAKHYFIGDDEVDKLVRRGAGWLPAHPEKDLIANRYLRYRRSLAKDALTRLAGVEGVVAAEDEVIVETELGGEAAVAPEPLPVRLNDLRIAAVIEQLKSVDPPVRCVIDLGCGEGRTMAAVLKDVHSLKYLAGMDVSSFVLERAERRLHLDRMGERERARIGIFQGSLVYRDARLAGFDAALLMEVVEHLDPDRLSSLVRVVWEFARPAHVIVTTPNADYNTVWESLPADKFRHSDHRFEWTRAEFQAWAESVAMAHGYSVMFGAIGGEDADGRGTPTQMAVFHIFPG